MNTPVAKFLSYIFHPLLMPTYLLGALFYFAPSGMGLDLLPLRFLAVLLLVVCVYTFIIPVIFVYGLIRLKVVQDISLPTLEERRYPFWMTIVVYAIATYFFGWRFTQVAEIAPVLRVVLGSITVSILISGLISLFWQISTHMTGVGGVSGFLLAAVMKEGDSTLMLPLLVAVLVSGWVAASRLQLNAHTPAEVLAGYLLGSGVCGLGMHLFL